MTSQEICRRLTEEINRDSPDGLGAWDLTWLFVEQPSDGFLEALKAWEIEDSPRNRDEVNRAARKLVRAWEEVGELFLLVEDKRTEKAHASI